MYEIVKCMLLFTIFIASYNCWVITDISYERINTDNSLNYKDIEEMSPEDEAQLRMNLIFPGTKWCGAGNIAADYDDLGTSRETDMCCRDHDNCPDLIPAGETKHNLTNTSFYTRLHCHCDGSFRACLRNANSTTAKVIGKFYFNTLGTKCYRQDYPVTGCSLHGGWLKTKCLKYTYDTSSEQLYQWFDVENF